MSDASQALKGASDRSVKRWSRVQSEVRKDLAMPHGLRKKIVSSHRFREKSMFAIQHGSYGASCRKISQKEIVQHQTLNGFVQR